MLKVELFQRCGDDFLAELMLKMRSEFAAPYQLIIPQGGMYHVPLHLFFVLFWFQKTQSIECVVIIVVAQQSVTVCL